MAGANQWVLCPVKLLPGDEAGGRGAAWAGEKVPALKPGAPGSVPSSFTDPGVTLSSCCSAPGLSFPFSKVRGLG